MSIGLIGKKVGMTRVFDDEGNAVAVTVVDVSDNEYLQVKTKDKDGYSAIQVGYDEQKEQRQNKPEKGHFKKHSAAPKKRIMEFRVDSDDELPKAAEEGGKIDHAGVETFEAGQWVDVIGTSKGKGFQGVYKRYNFGGSPASHGCMMHRRPGGIGCGTDPGRVWKNKEMPGRHGNYKKTIQNLKVVQTRPEDKVLLISGAVPGAKGGYLVIRPAIKKPLPEKKG